MLELGLEILRFTRHQLELAASWLQVLWEEALPRLLCVSGDETQSLRFGLVAAGALGGDDLERGDVKIPIILFRS